MKARNSLIACVFALGLAACEQGAEAGNACTQLRGTYDKAFKDSVDAGVRKAFKEQEKFIRTGQEAYLKMESRGCCRQENVCPMLNVH